MCALARHDGRVGQVAWVAAGTYLAAMSLLLFAERLDDASEATYGAPVGLSFASVMVAAQAGR